MNLDERSNQIFMTLVHSSQISSRHLMDQYDLSRGQVNYDLKKINDWLAERQLSPIKRTKSGFFLVAEDVIAEYSCNETVVNQEEEFLFSSQVRVYLLELMLLSKEEYVSLNHFIDALQLSKNTILRSLKLVEEDVKKHHLVLVYTRVKGYYIDGEEWYKRQLLRDTLNHLQGTSNSQYYISEFAQLDEKEIVSYRKRLEQIEKELYVTFTDEQMAILPSFYLLILRRINKGKEIIYNFEIDFDILADTQEFCAINQLFPTNDHLSVDEKIYVTLQLLATNVSRNHTLTKDNLGEMETVLGEVLDLFEQSTALKIENREGLLEQLMVHMKPAFYRIKYQMNFQNHYYDTNREFLSSLFYLVKNACQPLALFLNKTIPDSEIFFISLFIGGHIISENEKKVDGNREKAVIVCPNGISVSVLLEKTLRQLLPEIEFLPVMSIREFYASDWDIKCVFSVVPLKTTAELFVIKNYLTELEKQLLRKRVLSLIAGNQYSQLSPKKIMTVIKKYGAISNETELYQELLEIIHMDQVVLNQSKPRLIELINENPIQLFEEEECWFDVLGKLCGPLLERQVISDSYLKHLIVEFPEIAQQIVLRENIALPHTDPRNGALGVGMSLGISRKGVVYGNQRIHVVVVLASNDKEQHVDALLELMDLAGNSTVMAKILKLEKESEVKQLISEFSQDYWREQNGRASKGTS